MRRGWSLLYASAPMDLLYAVGRKVIDLIGGETERESIGEIKRHYPLKLSPWFPRRVALHTRSVTPSAATARVKGCS
jgi:hypothetical protein